MLTGKGMFIWKIRFTENGDLKRIVDEAAAAGLTHVLIKACDGAHKYNIAPVEAVGALAKLKALVDRFKALIGIRGPSGGVDLLPVLVRLLIERGIQPWIWVYIYGDYPMGEIEVLIKTIRALTENGIPPAGVVINAEAEYKEPGKARAARAYMQVLRAEYPDLPIALSSYRWPSLHPEFPWDAFLEYVDFVMPQVYWMQAHNPAEQLERTLAEYAALKFRRPVFPTLAAFHEHGWQPTPAEIGEAMAAAKARGLAGCNFWEWANCKLYLKAGWEVIRSFVWADTPDKPDEAPVDPPAQPPVEPIGKTHVTVLRPVRLRTDGSLDGDILVLLQPGTQLAIGGTTIDTPSIKWQEVRAFLATEQNGVKLAE